MVYSHQMEQKTLSTLSVNTPFYWFTVFQGGAEAPLFYSSESSCLIYFVHFQVGKILLLKFMISAQNMLQSYCEMQM